MHITAIILIFVGMAQAVQIPFLSDVIRLFNPSKVPQFVYDLENPWIIENKNWLEGRKTVLHDLCDLDSPLRNEGVEGRIYPADLFTRLEIDNNKAGTHRAGWKNALGRLREMKDCAAALNDVDHLHVNIFISDGKYVGKAESFDPGHEIPQLFADVLKSMPNLKRLDWGLPVTSTPFFEKVFKARNLFLAPVTHLVPGAFSHYLIPMCPSLKKLEAGSYSNHWSWKHYPVHGEDDPAQLLLKATALVPTITNLSYSRRTWDNHLAHKVLQAMPNLVQLNINGQLKGNQMHNPHEPGEGEDNGRAFKGIIHALRRCTQLERLGLPRAASLDFGFDGGHWCGNAYFGAGGRTYGRQVSKKNAQITERAGDIVMSILPHLNHFSIGSNSPEIIRSDYGTITLSWPWTGRMDEWLYEVWPEPENGTMEFGVNGTS